MFPIIFTSLGNECDRCGLRQFGNRGTELQVLETVPFDRVKIAVIGVHLIAGDFEKDTIKNFLAMKNYTLMQNINTNYIYMMNRLKV